MQGAVWTAIDQGDGDPIFEEFLIFRISDQNNFFVTKSLSPWLWSYVDILTLKLGLRYIGISEFDTW